MVGKSNILSDFQVQSADCLVEEKLRALQKLGVGNVLTSGPNIFHNGSLFYVIPGLAKKPELALDAQCLTHLLFHRSEVAQ